MSNLSELLPAGGAAKEFEPTASGTLLSGQAVILNSNGTVSSATAAAASMGTSADLGTSYKAGWESGACYHTTNNSTIVAFTNSANGYYPTTAVCTLSGTTVTMNTPVVINSNNCITVKCAYDVTQNTVVFFYKYNGSGNYLKVRAASVSGTSFTFGSEVSAFAGAAYATRKGDMCNLDDSKVAICWGESNLGPAVQVVSISGTTLTLGSHQGVSSGSSVTMRMASGKKGELLCMIGFHTSNDLQFVAATVSGTTLTVGTVTTVSGTGTSKRHDLASGFWNGYASPESTYIAAYHPPGGASGLTAARLITVSGTTLTLNTEATLTVDAEYSDTAMGWSSNGTQALYYYRPLSANTRGQVTEINYAGTTIAEGSTIIVGVGNYSRFAASYDQVAKKSIIIYKEGSNSDVAGVNVHTASSTDVEAFVGFTADAIASGASGVVNPEGGVATIPLSYIAATGGTITTDGDYKVHSFTSSGTFQITTKAGNPTLEILQIAGGGGGGRRRGGGGGAGGYVNESGVTASVASYAVTVGAGGTGAPESSGSGTNGGTSSIGSLVTASVGGGAGGGDSHGANGGSGGGGQGLTAGGNGGTATAGQGYAGITGSNLSYGGGGGGSSAIGGSNNGGQGTASSITGSAVTRAGGGGGWDNGAGYGGGGAGSSGGGVAGNATANTGSGGGGGGDDLAGGSGGSGIVIVRYKFQDSGLTPNSTYYVQNDGSIALTAASPEVKAGKALSTTSILLKG